MRRVHASLTAAEETVDVLVDLDDEGTVGMLADALAASSETTSDGRPNLWIDGRRWQPDVALADVGIHDGARLSLDADVDPSSQPPPTRGLGLQVLTGPSAGTDIQLRPGSLILGRDLEALAHDPTVSRRHAEITVQDGHVQIRDLGSANGTSVDGRPAPPGVGETTSGIPVLPGQCLRIGDVALRLARYEPADGGVDADSSGTLRFHRPPRLRMPSVDVRVEFPAPPVRRDLRPLPWLAMIAPAALGIAVALALGQIGYLLFAAMSPVMVAASAITDRRQVHRDHQRASRAHAVEEARAQQRFDAALATEIQVRRDELPDAAATARTALLFGRRLWERRSGEPDLLTIRVGTADLPARTAAHRPTSGPAVGTSTTAADASVPSVPVSASLTSVGVLGVAGPGDTVAGILRWFCLQLGVHCDPTALSTVLLAPAPSAGWEFLRWLPHVRSGNGQPFAAVGTDPQSLSARIAELLELIRTRRDSRSPPGSSTVRRPVVVVVPAVETINNSPGLGDVLTEGPGVGVHVLCGASDERSLPEQCGATVVVDPGGTRLTVTEQAKAPLPGVLVEAVDPRLAETVGRALAGVGLPGGSRSAAAEPARLLRLLDLDPPTAAAVRERWRCRPDTPTLPVGISAGGTVCLDLCRDGPHGLIAGTTGSGKSELLQTVVAGLAATQPPDRLNVLLVDYKGGSAFKACADLPHTVGMVTDLDRHMAERALASLTAEIRRREVVLAEAGVRDIEEYDAVGAATSDRKPLPRLVIVVDEFAALIRELPEFVAGLVGLAQRGRSLGLHLLLATQRPSGVVSPEIRANTNLRIAMRMTDAADSVDVVGVPDAARFDRALPGEAIARLGHETLLEFRAVRVGGGHPGQRPAEPAAPIVTRLPWHQLGGTAPPPPTDLTEEVTDLAVLVTAITEAAGDCGIDPQASPWLPPLPDRIDLQDVVAAAGGLEATQIPFGFSDLPAQQRRQPLVMDLAAAGHLAVVGSPGSGRTTALLSLVRSAAERLPPDALQVHGFDTGSGGLLPLTVLPHAGAITARTESDRAERLLSRLAEELDQRHHHAVRLPHLLVLIDSWEGFSTALGEALSGPAGDVVLRLAREGPSAGIHLLVAGDRSLATSRVFPLIENRLVLRLADRADFALAGLTPRQLPTRIPPGRAFAAPSAIESQIAVTDSNRPPPHADGCGVEPFRIDPLPARIGLREMWTLRRHTDPGGMAPVGVGGDELGAIGPDLQAVPAFVVAGPSGSGRSTALMTMARSLLASGACLVIGAPQSSPLRQLSAPGVLAVFDDPMTSAAAWLQAFDAAAGRPVVVVIDDGELWSRSPAAEEFGQIVRGWAPGRSLVFAGHSQRICTGLTGWQTEASRRRQGLLLSPSSSADGDLIGLRLPRHLLATATPRPGRGLLHLGDGRLVRVVIPHDSATTPSAGDPADPPARANDRPQPTPS